MTGQSAAAAGAPAPGSHHGPIPHSRRNLLGQVDYVLQPNIPKSILHTTAVCLVKGSADAVGAMHVINPTTDALARAPPTAVTAHASSGSACTVQQIPRSECEIDIQCVHDQLLRTSKHFMQYACTLGQSFAQSGRRASPGRIGRWRYGRRTKYPVRTLSQSVCTSPPPSFCSRTWSEGVPVLRRGSQAPGRVPLQLARSSGCSSTPLTTPSSRQTPPPPSSSLEGSSPAVDFFWWPRPFGNATPSASAALQRAGRRQPDGPRDQTSLDTNGPPCPPPSPWSRFLQPL